MGCNTTVMLVAHFCIMIFLLGAACLPILAVICNYIRVVGILGFSFGLWTLSNLCVVQAKPGRNEVYVASDNRILL